MYQVSAVSEDKLIYTTRRIEERWRLSLVSGSERATVSCTDCKTNLSKWQMPIAFLRMLGGTVTFTVSAAACVRSMYAQPEPIESWLEALHAGVSLTLHMHEDGIFHPKRLGNGRVSALLVNCDALSLKPATAQGTVTRGQSEMHDRQWEVASCIHETCHWYESDSLTFVCRNNCGFEALLTSTKLTGKPMIRSA